jgi:hypothetical protein
VTTYSYTALESLWIGAGGPVVEAPTAAAIAIAESGGSSTAYNPSGATGIWQILGMPSGVSGSLYTPTVNAKAAVAKYKQAPHGGNNFTPWTTYTSGTYKQYLKNVLPSTSNDFGADTADANAANGNYKILGIDTGQNINNSPLNTAVQAGSDVLSWTTELASFLGFLTSSKGVDRVLMVLGGGVMLLFALDALTKAGTGVSPATTIGKAIPG